MWAHVFQQRKIWTKWKLCCFKKLCEHKSVDFWVYMVHPNAPWSPSTVSETLTQTDSREKKLHVCKWQQNMVENLRVVFHHVTVVAHTFTHQCGGQPSEIEPAKWKIRCWLWTLSPIQRKTFIWGTISGFIKQKQIIQVYLCWKVNF